MVVLLIEGVATRSRRASSPPAAHPAMDTDDRVALVGQGSTGRERPVDRLAFRDKASREEVRSA
jgi:hypothetical protein